MQGEREFRGSPELEHVNGLARLQSRAHTSAQGRLGNVVKLRIQEEENRVYLGEMLGVSATISTLRFKEETGGLQKYCS